MINIRKLNAFDFGSLLKQPGSLQCLDSLRLVIDGEPTSLLGMASSLFGQKHAGVVLEVDGKAMAMGRVIQWQEEDFGQLQFISVFDSDETSLTAVIEALLQEVGGWGLLSVMGDIPVSSMFLKDFRKANFVVWSSHRWYNLGVGNPEGGRKSMWRTWTSKDYHEMKTIYQALVSPRTRSYEPMTRSKRLGKVLIGDNGKIEGYADLDDGNRGVWVRPFILPEAARLPIFETLIQDLYEEYGRPITVSARAYQPWLRPVLDQFGVQPSEEHALIARHLAVRQPSPEKAPEALFETGNAKGGVLTIKPQDGKQPSPMENGSASS